MTAALFDRFLGSAEMAAAFGAPAFVQHMLDVEAALARAQAAEGLIPAGAVAPIAAACRVERFELDALVDAGALAGSLAIPLVKRLTALVAADDAQAAAWVHWGTTSQDLIDTAMVLATRRAVALLDASIGALTHDLIALGERQGAAPMLARTLLQPALVASLGFKMLAWVAPLVRGRARLRAAARVALNLQLGGAVGTLAVMGGRGPAVARRVAEDLGLGHAPGAWHTQRDDWIALGAAVGILCGSMGKIATDWSLLAQAEVGELAEPGGAGRGGSSAMPHKRNPVASMVALAAALRAPQRVAALLAAMPQAHERGLGDWQAELAEWPALFLSAHGAAQALAGAAPGLAIDPARMRRNIDALHGLVFAESATMLLAPTLGKSDAQALLEALSRRASAERPLHALVQEAIGADARLAAAVSPCALAAAFDVDAAAAQAGEIAAPQWAALREQAAALEGESLFPA